MLAGTATEFRIAVASLLACPNRARQPIAAVPVYLWVDRCPKSGYWPSSLLVCGEMTSRSHNSHYATDIIILDGINVWIRVSRP